MSGRVVGDDVGGNVPSGSDNEIAESGGEPGSEGYQRGLGVRQIQMMAIGGAIGTGLFLGAGEGIAKAGPSLIAAYAVAGGVIFLIMRALGELVSYRPVSGSFAEYAREFCGPFAGFATGWTYWIVWITTGMGEITAAGKYIKFWWPSVPQWLTALVVLGVLFLANLVSVKFFGELEFWFAMIKIVAIVGMILIGIGVLTIGFSDAGDTASVTHLWDLGGFMPNGVWQALLALQMVMFAYIGVELVGVTAGESDDPRTTLPKAINTIPWRIGLFYVGSLFVILSVVKWTQFEAGTSPFVAAFAKIGIPAAAGIINFVVLTSAMSSCNSGGLYSTGRMLRNLGDNRQAPTGVSRLSRRHVPANGIALSAVVLALGVLINWIDPEHAFVYVTSVATCGILFVWGMICVCQLRYRSQVKAGLLPAAFFRMPGAPFSTWVALVFLALVAVLLGFSHTTRMALYVGVGWAVCLVISWAVMRSRGSAAAQADTTTQG